MCQLDRVDVTVNSGEHGRHTTIGDPPNKDIQKPRKGEIHFLPEYPEGMDDHNLDGAHQVLVSEIMKTKPNGSLIKKDMDVAFAFWRKEVQLFSQKARFVWLFEYLQKKDMALYVLNVMLNKIVHGLQIAVHTSSVWRSRKEYWHRSWAMYCYGWGQRQNIF